MRCDAAKGRSKDFNSDAFANTVWTLATVSHALLELVDALAEVAKGHLKDLKSHALAKIAWAFATAGVHRHCF